MARSTTSEAALGTTTLVTGSNEFVAERAIASAVRAVRAVDSDADIVELAAPELGAAALVEITSPSLFATARCVVVKNLEGLGGEAVEPLVSYVGTPAPDVALVLHHTGGLKGKAVLDKLRKAGAVEVKAQDLKSWEVAGWVVEEARRQGSRIDSAAAEALAEAVGIDMRALAGAVDQLVADSEGAPISAELVRRYFGGRAEVKGFSVADAAIEGKTSLAIEQLRWALSNRVDPVLITSAVAGGLRALARYVSAPRGLREADLAREIDVPVWKLKRLAAQSRSWSQRGLATAIVAAAKADADVKGAAGDRQWACERLVISVLRARALS